MTLEIKKINYSSQDRLKIQVAKAAVKYVKVGMKIAVGTGSTVDFFIKELVKIKSYVRCIASSSHRTTAYLIKNGFKVINLCNQDRFDLYIDGADEADKNGVLIKGGGGALTGEKICRVMSDIFICIIDKSKFVKTLGNFPVAVEVLPKACNYVIQELKKIGGYPIYRKNFTTDNGNFVLDVFQLNLINPYNVFFLR